MGASETAELTRVMGAKQDERRTTARRELDEDVYCYIESARHDARTRDISAGGMFLSSDEDIPMGSLVAMVFRFQASSGSSPVFLMGRVVRRQGPPRAGVGLCWERAVCSGPPVLLALFLRSTLGVTADDIVRRPIGRNREVMSLHVFDPPPSSASPGAGAGRGGASLRTPTSERAEAGERGPSSSAEPRSAGPVVLVSGAVEPELRPAVMPSGVGLDRASIEDPGPLTVRTDSDARAPADIPARVTFGGQTIAGRVSHLGLTGMFVATYFVPVEKSARLSVELSIRTRDGTEVIACQCRSAAIDDGSVTGSPGIDLDIIAADERSHPGLLRRYVKWLHHRSLAGE